MATLARFKIAALLGESPFELLGCRDLYIGNINVACNKIVAFS
jgi:hypothetical protein